MGNDDPFFLYSVYRYGNDRHEGVCMTHTLRTQSSLPVVVVVVVLVSVGGCAGGRG